MLLLTFPPKKKKQKITNILSTQVLLSAKHKKFLAKSQWLVEKQYKF